MTTQAIPQRNISQGIAKRTPVISMDKTFAKAETGSKRISIKKKSSLNKFSHALGIAQSRQSLIIKSIFGLFVISLCLYLYMVVSIVVSTVERKSLEEQVRVESTELSGIETQYSEHIGDITLAEVKLLGYVDAGEAIFAIRDSAPTLTLRNE